MLQSQSITEWCQTISPHLSRHEGASIDFELDGTLTLSAHDAAGFRYTRKSLNGAPLARGN
jgi:hypothetical protein